MVHGIGQHSYLVSKKIGSSNFRFAKTRKTKINIHPTNEVVNVVNNILKGDFLNSFE